MRQGCGQQRKTGEDNLKNWKSRVGYRTPRVTKERVTLKEVDIVG